MRRTMMMVGFVGAVAIAAACGSGSTEPGDKKPRAEDPYITVRVTNNLDTTTAVGRTSWRVYALVYSEDPNQQGFAPVGVITFGDRQHGFNVVCMGVGADSIGQRLIEPFAIGDTVNKTSVDETSANGVITAWMAGNQNLPTGWMVIRVPPVDAWTSEQFTAGHGRVPDDPIKWRWDWSGTGQTTFLEREATDTDRCNRA